ncbi:thiol-activated cytolysin family protein [Streptomyces sp. NPDC002994]|uniref:thiol-activated cytolysin family protein n=1 Tax=Streptomyces sp. NPDC002994 TaxID=3154441 RepID=UPI0033A3C75D
MDDAARAPRLLDTDEDADEVVDPLLGAGARRLEDDSGWELRWRTVPDADRYEIRQVEVDGTVQEKQAGATVDALQRAAAGADDQAMSLTVTDAAVFDVAGPRSVFRITALRGIQPLADYTVEADAAEDEPEDMTEYVTKLKSWKAIAQQATSKGEKTEAGKPTIKRETDDKGKVVLVKAREYNLTKEPAYLVIANPNADLLWPGAFVQGLPASAGALSELSISQRTPIKLTLSAMSLPTIKVGPIESPDASEVQEAIASKIRGQKPAAGQMYYSAVDAYSLESALLEANVSARYLGFSAEGNTKLETKSEEHTILVCFLHSVYTASCVGKDEPSDWFTDKLTKRKIKRLEGLHKIGVENPPLYVSEVTYGRSLIFALTTTEDVKLAKAAVKASYDGIVGEGKGELSAEYQNVLRSASYKIITRGGDSAAITSMIKTGKVSDYFAAPPTMDQYLPMSYTLKSLATGDIARLGETAKFTTVTREVVRSASVRIEPIRFASTWRQNPKADSGPVELKFKGSKIRGTAIAKSVSEYPAHSGWNWSPPTDPGPYKISVTVFLPNTDAAAWGDFEITVPEENLRGGVFNHTGVFKVENGTVDYEFDYKIVA